MSKRNYVSTEELQRRLRQQKAHLQSNQQLIQPLKSVTTTLGYIENKSGVIVHNWKSGWKWISNWMFLVIAYIAINGVPPEIMAIIPIKHQGYVIAFCAIAGIGFRFYNQSRPKTLPPVQGDADV